VEITNGNLVLFIEFVNSTGETKRQNMSSIFTEKIVLLLGESIDNLLDSKTTNLERLSSDELQKAYKNYIKTL
jgi:hypothetical protein